MELISVIVPVYKVEKYLDRCVDSIVNQVYKNLEIILVDDGSPDNCPAMCDTWAQKDSRIKVIHKENGGLSDARNAGMTMATGEYIAFVDSDDWVHPEYLSLLHRAAKNFKVSMTACDYLMTTDDEVIVSVGEQRFEKHNVEQALEMLTQNRGYRAVAWNKLYHRSLLEGEAYPLGRYHEDEFFTYRIMDKAVEMAYVDTPLYFYLQRSESIMQTVSIKHLDALDAYLERLELFKEKYPKLYRSDKVNFCITCVNNYAEALKTRPTDFGIYDRRIRACRKQVKVSFSEFMELPMMRKAYVMGGRIPYLFCSVLNVLREKRNG